MKETKFAKISLLTLKTEKKCYKEMSIFFRMNTKVTFINDRMMHTTFFFFILHNFYEMWKKTAVSIITTAMNDKSVFSIYYYIII